jgi:hypothetical protein
VGSVADAGDSGAGVEPGQNPVAAGVDFDDEDLEAGDCNFGCVFIGRRGGE